MSIDTVDEGEEWLSHLCSSCVGCSESQHEGKFVIQCMEYSKK